MEVPSAMRSDSHDDIPQAKSVTYIDHDNPFSLVHSASGAPHITRLSRNAWVGCGDNVYVLECLGKGYIRIQPYEQGKIEPRSVVDDDSRMNEDVEDEGDDKPGFVAHFTPAMMHQGTANALKMSPFARSRKIMTATTLDEAMKGCDTYATSKVVFGPMALG